MKKLELAVIGQGRSGKDIHGRYYRSPENEYFNVKYVVEQDEFRRKVAEEIYPGCRTLSDWRELIALGGVDLVVNASYSDMHYPITKELLANGFNVMVEKPMARSLYECEDLIKTAKTSGALLVPFQQTFFAPYYLNAQKIIASGVLGEITQINISYSGFARRWDWQTLQKKMAGSVYNTGPHPIGLALGFLDFADDARLVYSRLGRALTSGDADDCAKLLFTAPGRPLVDVEINSNDAYPSKTLKVLGTRGTLLSDTVSYKLTYIVEGENPERPVQEKFLQNEKGDPIYCSETLLKHEESGEFEPGAVFTGAVAHVYKETYLALTEGRPLTITPEKAARIISAIDTAHAENPLPLIY